MTWKSHTAFNGLALFVLTQHGGAFLIAAPLAALPDLIEKVFRSKHRGWSHSAVLWIGLLAAAFSLRAEVPLLFASSGLLHVLADACSKSGVPLWSPNGPHLALKFYKTGTTSELAFLAAMGCISIAWLRYG